MRSSRSWQSALSKRLPRAHFCYDRAHHAPNDHGLGQNYFERLGGRNATAQHVLLRVCLAKLALSNCTESQIVKARGEGAGQRNAGVGNIPNYSPTAFLVNSMQSAGNRKVDYIATVVFFEKGGDMTKARRLAMPTGTSIPREATRR